MGTKKNMAPVPVGVAERPKWKQDEMFRAEEYPTGQGIERYMPSRKAEDLTPDEVRTIRRLVKLKQDVGALARGYRISSAACRDVAELRDRAEVPSDFESPGQARLRESKHRENEERKAMHWAGSKTGRTACDRIGSTLRTTDKPSEVTCAECKHFVGEG